MGCAPIICQSCLHLSLVHVLIAVLQLLRTVAWFSQFVGLTMPVFVSRLQTCLSRSTGLHVGLVPEHRWRFVLLSFVCHDQASACAFGISEQTGRIPAFANTSFWGDAVLPGDPLDLSKAAHVKRVESTLMAGVQGPSFAALKQIAEHAAFRNVHLVFRCQHSVVPHPFDQTSHCYCCLADPLV